MNLTLETPYNMNKFKALFIAYLLVPFVVSGQSLELKKIMSGYDWIGHSPDKIRWSADSKHVFFDWNPENKAHTDLYRYDISTKKISKATEQERWLNEGSIHYNEEHTARVFTRDGDIYYQRLPLAPIRVTHTSAFEKKVRFSHDEKGILFQISSELYEWDIKTGQLRQWVEFSQTKQKEVLPLNKQQQWIADEEMALFTIHQRHKSRRKAIRAHNLESRNDVAEIFIGKKKVVHVDISPDRRYITYLLSRSAKAESTTVPDYVTEKGSTKDLRARPKVGSGARKFEMWFYDLKEKKSFPLKTSKLKGIYRRPDHFFLTPQDSSTNRANFINGPIWSKDGKKALIEIKAIDNKDRWLALLDLQTGEPQELYHQRDSAWIGGPGVGSYYISRGNIGWLPDNKHIYFQSEETGWSHLYVMDIATGKKEALTQGNWEVKSAELSKDKKYWYLTTSEADLGQQQFYKMSLVGGKRKLLTKLQGRNDVSISPDGKYLAIRSSSANKPWEIYLQKNKAGAKAEKLTDSQTKKFKAYPWRKPEFIQFQARDSINVPARLYKPREGKANGAAIIFVHGAGYLQNAHKWWSNYYREYMFHNFLVDKGYTVLDIDYRGSAGYGRNWRTAIYRHMGGKDLDDQVDGAKYLIQQQGIDPQRIGIYGGSYGGFITLMAMFKEGDTFKCGAALRSVTDWAHYNHGYTMNILNTPITDGTAYRRSSPIYFAEGLKGKLLMLHGMVDTNVQFQDVVRLSQRLIELGKNDWDVAIFPKEGHGFREADSWYDEYRRIYELFEENLR